MSADIERLLDSATSAVRRIAMRIVGLQADQRSLALRAAEQDFTWVAEAAGWESARVATFVELQTRAVRELVKEIETAGGAKGGRA
jgi:hypothetical protein